MSKRQFKVWKGDSQKGELKDYSINVDYWKKSRRNNED